MRSAFKPVRDSRALNGSQPNSVPAPRQKDIGADESSRLTSSASGLERNQATVGRNRAKHKVSIKSAVGPAKASGHRAAREPRDGALKHRSSGIREKHQSLNGRTLLDARRKAKAEMGQTRDEAAAVVREGSSETVRARAARVLYSA